MSFNLSRSFFKALKKIELKAALARGKGYGASSIQQEVKLTQRFLRCDPKLAVDVGGNIGEYTAELRRKNPCMEIHIFEPSQVNISKLRARFTDDALIHLVPTAVSENSGQAILFSDQLGSGLGSLSKRKLDHFSIEFNQKEAVKTIRFEEYWKSHLQSRIIDLVKIDVEGHELSVLNGFGEAIKVTRVIQFEFGGCNIDTRTFFQDFWYFFKHYEFDLYRITPFGTESIRRYDESEEAFRVTNYIAVNRCLTQCH